MNQFESFRAQDFGRERMSAASVAHMPLALLDEIECGMIVCDEEGEIQYANQAALHELASHRLLFRIGNTLRSVVGSRGNIDAAVRQAAQRSRRSLVRLTQGGDQLMISVVPVQPHDTVTHQVLVMLGRREPCSDLGLEMLASCYGLTLAERRVLGALLRQATPGEIASANAVKLSTVRTQISSIRSKLGARSIEDLLFRAAQMPPVAGALRQARAPCIPAQAAQLLAA